MLKNSKNNGKQILKLDAFTSSTSNTAMASSHILFRQSMPVFTTPTRRFFYGSQLNVTSKNWRTLSKKKQHFSLENTSHIQSQHLSQSKPRNNFSTTPMEKSPQNSNSFPTISPVSPVLKGLNQGGLAIMGWVAPLWDKLTPYHKLRLIMLFLLSGGGGFGLGFLMRNIFEDKVHHDATRPIQVRLGVNDAELVNVPAEKWDSEQLVERSAINLLENKFQEIMDKTATVKKISITGVEGTGKTELARAYAARYDAHIKERYPNAVRTIINFTAEDKNELERQYRNFAERIGVDIRGPIKKVIQQVNQKLSDDRPHFLFIFDNVIDYNSVEQYVPDNKSLGRRWLGLGMHYENLTGQVLFTTREYKAIFSREMRQNIKDFDLNDRMHQFTPEETIKFFDKIHPRASSVDMQHQEFKLWLAEELAYLPMAIQRATALIRENNTNVSQLPETIRQVVTEFRQSANLIKGQKLETKDYLLINNTINQMCINALKNKSEPSYHLLALLAVLQPDRIHQDIVRGFLMEEMNQSNQVVENCLNAMGMLSAYGLLQRRGNENFSIHRSVQTALLKSGDKEVKQALIKFFNFMFSDKRFTRDNGTNERMRLNLRFIPHIEKVVTHAKKLMREDPQLIDTILTPTLFSLICAACYYTQRGQPYKAKELFEKGIKLCQTLVDKELPTQNTLILETPGANKGASPEAMCQLLAKQDSKLPTVYTIFWYWLGRLYFYTRSPSKHGQTLTNKDYFSQCQQASEFSVQLRQVIDSNRESYDDSYNEKQKDSLLVEQIGSLYFLLESDNKEVLEKAKQRYEELLTTLCRHSIEVEERRNKRDNHRQLARVYQKLGKITREPWSKQSYEKVRSYVGHRFNLNIPQGPEDLNKKYYEGALFHAFQALKMAMTNGDDEKKPSLIPVAAILKELNTLVSEEKQKNPILPIRLADFYNILAKILLDKENPYFDSTLAEKMLLRAIEMEEDAMRTDFPLAEAYLYLSKHYGDENKFDDALEFANKSIAIQLKMKRVEEHPDLIQARAVVKEMEIKEIVIESATFNFS